MKLIVANWKLYLNTKQSVVLAKRIASAVRKPRARVVISPTALALDGVVKVLRGTSYSIGAQDVGIARQGPYTGEIAPQDLRALGCRYAIVGHSERRRLLGESDAVVRQKLETALAAGLFPILCVGESMAERREGETHAVIRRQLAAALKNFKLQTSNFKPFIIAYEPVWAISAGPGRPAPQPTSHDITATHQFIRKTARALLGKAPRLHIIYGGSVDKKTLPPVLDLPEVDGVLIGGASTKPSFVDILREIL